MSSASLLDFDTFSEINSPVSALHHPLNFSSGDLQQAGIDQHLLEGEHVIGIDVLRRIKLRSIIGIAPPEDLGIRRRIKDETRF